MVELRNVLNDLKIYFIGPPVNDPLIRPWSVVGRYVRRCIIIYEKMSFDKIVTLCKQASVQFKILSSQLGKNRTSLETSTNKSINKNNSNTDHNYEIDNYHSNHSNSPMSGALFLNDESNLTITGDYMNRSANDCSGMDLDESLGHQLTHSNNKDFVHKFHSQSHFNVKALTSTVSAQRTHSLANYKVIINCNVKISIVEQNDRDRFRKKIRIH